MIFARSVIGLALSDAEIGVVTLAGGRVTQAFSIEQGEGLAPLFKTELQARKVRARGVRVSLPRAWGVVKEFELPPTVGEDVSQMVAFEIERHLPFPIEEAVYDVTLRPSPKNAPRKVAVVAVERRAFDQVKKLASEVGLKLLSIDLAPHALTQLVEPPLKGHRVALLFVAGRKADLVFLEGRETRLSRSVPLNASPDEALAQEIHRTLGLLRWQGLDQIWISGDEADQLLGSPRLAEIGAAVAAAPFTREAQQAFPRLEGELQWGLALPALGAALGRRPQVNLLPIDERPRSPEAKHLLTAASLLVAIAAGSALLFAQGFTERRAVERLTREIANLNPEVKRVEQLSQEVEQNRKLLGALKNVEAAGIKPLPLLKELTELIPQDAWLTNLSMDTKGVELTGQATTANQLIPLLENSALLERAEFASPVTRGREKEQFRIRAGWEEKPGTPPPAAKPGR